MNRSTPPAVGAFEEAGKTVLRLGPYRLGEKLGQGGMGVVFRAEHVETGELVAAKTARDSSQVAVSSIRREIEILEQLAHPGVISLLDHGSVDGLPWLAMELLEGSTLLDLLEEATPSFESRSELAAPQTTGSVGAHLRLNDGPGPLPADNVQVPLVRRSFDIGELRPVLEVLRRLCHTLSYLHSEGVVHGDLKPSNVSLRVKRRPVLVDFGVTALFEGGHSRERIAANDGGVAGTLAYMAPELLRGQLVDARVDLYALGCMLYLAVAGQLPFRAPSPEKVVVKHLGGTYRPLSELVDGLPEQLDTLIARLLASEPEQRLGHADVVADTLGALLGVDEQDEAEQQKSRSHHLHKPGFVGRQEILEQLLAKLGDPTLEESEESTEKPSSAADLLLVGARAGMGKTRLAMEFSAAAERAGMQVTIASADIGAGAGVQAGHAPPLWVFRPTLRAIADRCREHGERETARVIGRRAAVLAQYEPALAGASGESKLVNLPARAARARLFTYLTETLIAFAAERPLLIVIDDLHLADELSLEFMASALQSGGLDNVVIAATFRLEHRPRLASVFAHGDVTPLRLERLDDEAVASLVADMLALSEPPDEFVEMVIAESGGNPFVVSEYVHAAVEQGLLKRGDDGSWEIDARLSTPDDSSEALSVSGRLQALIEGRLQRLDRPERRVVDLAAVVGRRANRKLLIELSGLDARSAKAALEALVERSLLEDKGGAVRLVEQVRRVAYEQLDERRRQDLHRRVARTLEREAPYSQNLLHLAEQWRAAGVRSRELCYVEKAAEQALGHGAFATARTLLERGLVLIEQLERRDGGELPVRRAGLERLLALTHRSAGEVDRAATLLERSLSNLGCPLPEAPLQWGVRGAWEAGCQIAHMLVPGGRDRRPSHLKDAEEEARLREVLETGLTLLWPLVQRGQAPRAAVLSVILANLADRLDAGQSYALPYAAIGEAFRYLGVDALGEFYMSRARSNVIDGLQRPVDFTGTIQIFVNDSAGRGDWQTTDRLLRRAIDSSEEVGDRLGVVNLSLTLALVEVLRDRLDRAEALAARLHTLAASSDTSLAHTWNQLVVALIARQRDEHERACELIDPLPGRLGQHFQLMARGFALSLKASSLAAAGDAGPALRAGFLAADTFEALTTGGDFNFGLYHLYQCLPQAFIGCWQMTELAGYERERALALGRRITGRLQKLAERFPVARPASLRNLGLLQAIDGRFDRASALFSESLLEARRAQLPFEDRLTRRAAASLGSMEPARTER